MPEPFDTDREARRADDAALLARIVERDERAVEALYERYSRQLYSLAYQVTKADRFAQDVVQEVFVAVWKDASRFDATRGALGPWLFSLARHKAIDLVRREPTCASTPRRSTSSSGRRPDDVDREAWLNLRRDRVREAIGQLTETAARRARARVLLRTDPRRGRRATRHPAGDRQDPDPVRIARACAMSWAPRCPKTNGTIRSPGSSRDRPQRIPGADGRGRDRATSIRTSAHDSIDTWPSARRAWP